ncbi:hypothetical protein BP5796_07012 [Coleophoma crateriformis]|uniref:Serine hydrolase domain-containing protein n=1 Tax=Coleophoma crateriformis TaxID=565419 RepID=A0A3D8RQW3_9HELO|nr:hypothetical protein BP5796_07012 [Coleophoma crateriformis]
MAKPSILCLHGEGCSAEILAIQTRALRLALPQFEFHFVDAPFASPAGPGILPFFEPPYYSWIKQDSASPGADARVVRSFLEKPLALGNFNGVLAFSQGCRVATGLLRDAVLKKGLEFGVFLSGTYPPLCLDGDCATCYLFRDQGLQLGGAVTTKQPLRWDHGDLVAVPSLHIHASRDPFLRYNRLLLGRCFDADTSWLIEIEGDHQIPNNRGDVDALRLALLEIWEELKSVDDLRFHGVKDCKVNGSIVVRELEVVDSN